MPSNTGEVVPRSRRRWSQDRAGDGPWFTVDGPCPPRDACSSTTGAVVGTSRRGWSRGHGDGSSRPGVTAPGHRPLPWAVLKSRLEDPLHSILSSSEAGIAEGLDRHQRPWKLRDQVLDEGVSGRRVDEAVRRRHGRVARWDLSLLRRAPPLDGPPALDPDVPRRTGRRLGDARSRSGSRVSGVHLSRTGRPRRS